MIHKFLHTTKHSYKKHIEKIAVNKKIAEIKYKQQEEVKHEFVRGTERQRETFL